MTSTVEIEALLRANGARPHGTLTGRTQSVAGVVNNCGHAGAVAPRPREGRRGPHLTEPPTPPGWEAVGIYVIGASHEARHVFAPTTPSAASLTCRWNDSQTDRD